VECDLYPIRSPLGDACQGGTGVRLLPRSSDRRSVLDVWKIAPMCLMWSTWREQNARYVEDCEKTKEERKNNLVKSLFSWTTVHNIFQFSNFFEFVVFFVLACKGDFLCIHPVY